MSVAQPVPAAHGTPAEVAEDITARMQAEMPGLVARVGRETLLDALTTGVTELLAADTPAEPCTALNGQCHLHGEDDMHLGPELALDSPSGALYLCAALYADADGTVVTYDPTGSSRFQNLDADALRAEVTRIRAHCTALEALADQLAAIETKAGQ